MATLVVEAHRWRRPRRTGEPLPGWCLGFITVAALPGSLTAKLWRIARDIGRMRRALGMGPGTPGDRDGEGA